MRNLVLKINHTIRGPADTAIGHTPKKADKSAPTRSDALGESEHVHISALSTGTQVPAETIDAAKVAEVKQAISEGRFKVNADVVADRLLEAVKELIQNKRTTRDE